MAIIFIAFGEMCRGYSVPFINLKHRRGQSVYDPETKCRMSINGRVEVQPTFAEARNPLAVLVDGGVLDVAIVDPVNLRPSSSS